MAVEGGGPNIIDDGLVFALDAANIRSYPGNATTNLSYNNGQGGSEYLANSIAWTNSGTWTLNTNNTSIDKPTILDIPNLPTLPTTLRVISGVTDSVGSQHHGCAWTNISPSTTYTMSVWFRQNRAGNSGPYLRTNVNNNQIGTFSYNGSTNTSNWPVNTWIRITATGTTQANENAIYLSNYIGGQVGDAVYYYGHQTEVGSTATPLVAGTRSAAWNSLVGGIGGTPTNGPTYSSSNGGTIVFDGSNDTISITKPNPNISGYISLCVWVKFNNYNSSPIVIHKGSHYTFQMRANVGTDYWTYADSSTYSYATFGYRQASGLYQTNTWMYLVVTKDSSNAVRLYKNGVLLDTRTGFGSSLSQTNTTLWLSGYSDTDSAPTNNLLNGEIGIVQIYEGTLSGAQILQNFNAQRKRFGV